MIVNFTVPQKQWKFADNFLLFANFLSDLIEKVLMNHNCCNISSFAMSEIVFSGSYHAVFIFACIQR